MSDALRHARLTGAIPLPDHVSCRVRRPSASLPALLVITAALVTVMLAWGLASAASQTGARARAAQAPREASCPIFPANNPLNQEISKAPVNVNSARYIESIGAGLRLHRSFAPDPRYGIPYTVVPRGRPRVPIRITESRATSDPGPYPIPPNAPVEQGSDHHVLVLQEGSCRLYEMWEARHVGNGWEAGAGAIFNLTSNALRRDGSASADAAGLPIFPLLARYPEVRAGAINHALRVTVPRTQRGYIHPAIHFSSSSNDPSLPPMGLRLRLKASFSLAGFHGQALVVLQALKRYGLIVADNGGQPWSITGAYNPGWSDRDLQQIETVPGSAFEAVNTGPILHGSGAPGRGPHRRSRR